MATTDRSISRTVLVVDDDPSILDMTEDLLTEAGFDGWAVLEWECCVKSPEQGAAEGAPFIARHIIEATDVAFDDFAGGESDDELNKKILGLA